MKGRVLLILGLLTLLWAGWQAGMALQIRSALRDDGWSAAQVAALAQRRDAPALWERAGWLAWRADQPYQARAFLLRAAAEGALSTQGYGLLGDVYASDGLVDNALGFWQQAVARQAPQAAVWHFRLAQVAESQQDWPQAIAHYRAAAQGDAGNPQAAYRLGLLLAVFEPDSAEAYLSSLAAGRSPYAAAAEDIRRSLLLGNLRDDSAYAATLVGRALGRQNEWPLAVAALQHATASDPQYAEAWAFLGQALESNGQDGRAALETALRLNPNSLAAASLMAVYWRTHDEASRALVYAYRVAEIEPQNPLWQMEIGATLAQMGELSAALSHYREAANLQPDSPQGWRVLADFCLKYNIALEESALPAARRAVLLAPEAAGSLETLARVYIRLGDLLLARRLARQAIAHDPGLSAAYFDLGIIAALQGDSTLAQRMFETVIALAPNSGDAIQARRMLAP
ncbi:MAG: hypothetical protein Fur0018_14100 [Anaerolineales bacterium]